MGIKHKAKSEIKKAWKEGWKKLSLGKRGGRSASRYTDYHLEQLRNEIMKWRGTYGHRKISFSAVLSARKSTGSNEWQSWTILLGRLISTVATWHIQPMDLRHGLLNGLTASSLQLTRLNKQRYEPNKEELDKAIEYYEDMLNQNVPLDMEERTALTILTRYRDGGWRRKINEIFVSVDKTACRMRQHIVLML